MNEPPRAPFGNLVIGWLAIIGLAAIGCVGIGTFLLMVIGVRLAEREGRTQQVTPAAHTTPAPVAIPRMPQAPVAPQLTSEDWTRVVVNNPEPHTPFIAGPARVIDGDSLEISGTQIRLHGIDAPEAGQSCLRANQSIYPCGTEATAVLRLAIAGAQVRCHPIEVDHYGRTVAKCWAGQGSLNATMVSVGAAVAYRAYSLDYVDEEALAQAARMGLWAGQFQMPWEWRRR